MAMQQILFKLFNDVIFDAHIFEMMFGPLITLPRIIARRFAPPIPRHGELINVHRIISRH
jgi:hypothetical protein